MTDLEPDERLVRRYIEGDGSAFAALVRRHESRLYNVCLRVLGDPDDARDATQDAFLAALRRINQFRGDAAFTTWMHRIAINACYAVLRRRRRQPMLHLVGEDRPQHDVGTPAPDHADDVARAVDVAAALAALPEEFRVALVLADVQDMPYDDIAAVLDVPIGTVKSRVHRGRVALARAMGFDRPGTGASPPGDAGDGIMREPPRGRPASKNTHEPS